jgi:obg-like ATPase 1
LSVTDIAGLVRGAHEGEGLGNAFLSHIRAVDGIFHVSRVFEDADVTHVEGAVDPVRDMEIIAQELRLKDIETVSAEVNRLEKIVQRIDRTKKFDLDTCQKVLALLESGKDVRFGQWNSKEVCGVSLIHQSSCLTTNHL